MNLREIVDVIRGGRSLTTDHAYEEARSDGLAFGDIYFSTEHGEIIEEYPVDKSYPSCLVFGKSTRGNPIHSVWAYDEESRWAVLVTVYRPDPARWVGWRERRTQT